MAPQPDLNAEALARGAPPGQSYALARTISSLFHPVLINIATIFIVGCYSGPTLLGGLGWAALCTVLQVVPGTAFFVVRMRQGAYSDEDVSQRHQRNELYLFSLANLAVTITIVWLLGAPPLVKALLFSGLAISILSWLINLVWKISVHAGSVASCATVASLLSPPLGALVWLCAAAVAWARVRTRNHTLAQVAAGTALAAICVLVTFRAMGLASPP